MNYHFGRSGKRPTVACDAAVFARKGGRLFILLVKRGKAPFKGKWALPGGFVEWGESCDQAVARELKEETAIRGIKLRQFGVFSTPGRDPRGTIISIAYFGMTGPSKMKARGGDDAAEARWVEVSKCPRLAFDHDLMLKNALQSLKEKSK